MDKPDHLRPMNTDQTVALIAEDDVLIRNVARLVLENEGYFILTAQNGDEALTISRLYPGTIHALLSDVVMPKLDGLKLTEMVLKERPGIKILLMSGTAAPGEHIPFLRKPFGPSVLKTRLRQLLEPSDSSR